MSRHISGSVFGSGAVPGGVLAEMAAYTQNPESDPVVEEPRVQGSEEPAPPTAKMSNVRKLMWGVLALAGALLAFK